MSNQWGLVKKDFTSNYRLQPQYDRLPNDLYNAQVLRISEIKIQKYLLDLLVTTPWLGCQSKNHTNAWRWFVLVLNCVVMLIAVHGSHEQTAFKWKSFLLDLVTLAHLFFLIHYLPWKLICRFLADCIRCSRSNSVDLTAVISASTLTSLPGPAASPQHDATTTTDW